MTFICFVYKIAESWFNFDMLSLLQQIGAVPTPEQDGA
jgi:hypothetical protein